jgi:hypothetical protein
MLKSRNTLLSMLMIAVTLFAVSCSDDDDPKTAPAAPVLGNATEITATGFKANWTAVPNADKYLLDVSLEADFDPAITGYAKKEVTGTSHAVVGLTAQTKYYYRLYAKDGSLVSAASAGKDVTTIAAAP